MSFTNQSDLMLEDNASKDPAIEVLAKLGYTYISPEDEPVFLFQKSLLVFWF